MFFNKVNMEYTEKEVIEDFIFNLIDIANKNNNKYNDYISIIAILYKLKETYPKFNNIYDRYLKEFDEAKFLQEFERVKYKNNVYKQLSSLNQFDEPDWNMIPERYMWYSTCIALLGAPKSPKITHLISKWYSWNLYGFAKPAIYYTKLLINQGFDDKNDGDYDDNLYVKIKKHRFKIYMQLADNYMKIKNGEEAKKYYNKAHYYNIQVNLKNKIEKANHIIESKNK